MAQLVVVPVWFGRVISRAVRAPAAAVLTRAAVDSAAARVIAHAWLHIFGVPEGMRVVPLERPAREPRVGLVLPGTGPASVMARALLDIARDLDLREVFDRLTRRHLA